MRFSRFVPTGFKLGALMAIAVSACLPVKARAESHNLNTNAPNVMVVLDASNSMWGRIEGVPKISAARDALNDLLPKLSNGANVGIMAYGHRSKSSCADIEILRPISPQFGPADIASLQALSPKGKTPIGDALQIAGDALKAKGGSGSIVLISDGVESCGADPCLVAKGLREQGLTVSAHVIGLALSSDEASRLSCIAAETGGKVFNTRNVEELAQAIKRTSEASARQPYAPDKFANIILDVRISNSSRASRAEYDWHISKVDASGGATLQKIITASAPRLRLQDGNYQIALHHNGDVQSKSISVTANVRVQQTFILNAGELELTIRDENGIVTTPATLTLEKLDQDLGVAQESHVKKIEGQRTFSLAPGRYRAIARIAEATAENIVTIQKGKTTPVELFFGAGKVRFAVQSVGAIKLAADQILYEIFEGQQSNLTGLTPLRSGRGILEAMQFPAGDYTAKLTLDESNVLALVPFTLTDREVTNANVAFDVGSVVPQVETVAREVGNAFLIVNESNERIAVKDDKISKDIQFWLKPGRYQLIELNGENRRKRIDVQRGLVEKITF